MRCGWLRQQRLLSFSVASPRRRALGFGPQQLKAHGEFHPYAAAIGGDGQADMISTQRRIAND
jgi:hypothetical protein